MVSSNRRGCLRSNCRGSRRKLSARRAGTCHEIVTAWSKIVQKAATFCIGSLAVLAQARRAVGVYRVYTGSMLRAHKEAVDAIKSAQKRVEKAKQERDKAKAKLKQTQARLDQEKEQLRRSQERLES